MPHGPAAGEAGMRANVEAVEAARTAIGPDALISLDCYMPTDFEGYRRIRDAVHCRVTGGEHTFTLDGFRRLVVEGGVDIVQPDIYRAGGAPTVLEKVAALAQAYGRELIW